MKTFRIGLTLASVLAARLTLGQEAPPPPPVEPAPSEPSPTPPPPAPSETAPSDVQPPPEPSSTAAFPTPPQPSSTATFPTPPPPPAPPPSATLPVPSAAPSARPPAPPPAAQSPDEKKKQSQRVDELAKKEKEVEGKDDSHGVFGPFRIGPVVGVGLPALLSFGGAIKLTKYFGAGLNVGIVPELQFDYYGDATVSYQSINVYGHIHPLGGGFFLGAGVGYAHVRGTYEEEFDISDYVPPNSGFDPTLPYTSEATVQTLVLTPELGYFFTFKSGFTMGVDFGIQIPIAPSEIDFESRVDSELPDEVVRRFIDPTDERVESTLERVGQTVLPTFGIKLGWLF